MSLLKDRRNILKFLEKEMVHKPQTSLHELSKIEYDSYNDAWAIAITVTIKDFENLVDVSDRSEMIRLIQSFSYSIISVGKNSNNFVDGYFDNGKVVVILNGDSQQKVTDSYQTLIDINSIANHLLPNLLIENGINIKFKAGVGAWLSNNNSIIRYGYRKNISHGLFTTIGESIKYSSLISEKANEDGRPEILYNKNLASNMAGEGKDTFEKWGAPQSQENDEEVFGYSVRWNSYAE